jgi:acyl carrier protein
MKGSGEVIFMLVCEPTFTQKSTEMVIEQIQDEVREFVTRTFFSSREEAIRDDDSFFDLGLLDSLAVLQLVSFLHERFEINMEEELSPENLDSISRIARFVASKLG